MNTQLSDPAPIFLHDFTDTRRESGRPFNLRESGFAEKYDDDTLFYDGFQAPSGSSVILLGPPFRNLKPLVSAMTVRALPSGAGCVGRLREFDRHARIWIRTPPNTTSLDIATPEGRFTVQAAANGAANFAGRRVLLTQSKDNEIVWIQDWIRFHRDVHGADAVLIYDNGSRSYDASELLNAIGRVRGIGAAMVVKWPFKYGPGGTRAGLYWDSNYSQYGILEHARWRFLSAARAVLHGDIDELVVAADGRSVFDAAERSTFGVVRYYGAWVVGTLGGQGNLRQGKLRRHAHYNARLRPKERRRLFLFKTDENASDPKWTVVPRRCPRFAQWQTHKIARWLPGYLSTSAFEFRHFRAITTNWKYRRDPEPYDPARHLADALLERDFAKVSWEE